MAIIAPHAQPAHGRGERVPRRRASGTQAHTEMRELGLGRSAASSRSSTSTTSRRKISAARERRLRPDGRTPTTSSNVDSINWLKTAWPLLDLPRSTGTRTGPRDQRRSPSKATSASCSSSAGSTVNGQPARRFSTNQRNPMDRHGGQRHRPVHPVPGRPIGSPMATQPAAGFRSYIDPWKASPTLYFTAYGKQKGYNATGASPDSLGSLDAPTRYAVPRARAST